MKNSLKTFEISNDLSLDRLVAITKNKLKETEQGKEFILADLFNKSEWYSVSSHKRTSLGRQIGRYNEEANILIVLDKDDKDRQRYRKK